MQLTPMRFTKIDGTAVAVTVTSTVEAKAALKELRHKKRELKFLRTALARERTVLRARRAKAKREVEAGEPGMLDTFVSDLKWGITAIAGGGRSAEQAPKAPEPRTLAEVERELAGLDETLHNIDGCIVQLQGKLLDADTGKPRKG